MGPEASCLIPAPPPVEIPTVTVRPQKQEPGAIESDPLETLQLLETALREAEDTNTLVHTIHRDGGFARVSLALLNPSNTDHPAGRVFLGVEEPVPRTDSLSGSPTKAHPHFLQLMKRSDAVWMKDFAVPLNDLINPKSLRTWKPGSAIVALPSCWNAAHWHVVLRQQPTPRPVQQKDYHAFQLFFGQTTLSINR